MPAGDSALITLTARGVGLPTVAADRAHGSRAFYARTIGSLVERLPWDKVGDLDGVVAKAAACAGGALALAEQQGLEIDSAIDQAGSCFDMANEISMKWNERIAKAPAPKANVLRSGISTAAREGTTVAGGVRRLATNAFSLLAR